MNNNIQELPIYPEFDVDRDHDDSLIDQLKKKKLQSLPFRSIVIIVLTLFLSHAVSGYFWYEVGANDVRYDVASRQLGRWVCDPLTGLSRFEFRRGGAFLQW